MKTLRKALEEAYDENDLKLYELYTKLVLTEQQLEEQVAEVSWWEEHGVDDDDVGEENI